MAKIYVEVIMFRFKYGKKRKYFPYGNLMTPPIIGWCPRTKQPIRSKRYKKKDNSNTILFIAIIVACFVSLFLVGCSYTPVVDSRGKSSANIEGNMDRFHDDLYTCKDIANDNTNEVLNVSKKVYNAFRWRVLWISPKLKTDKDMVDRCLEGRGYSVLN